MPRIALFVLGAYLLCGATSTNSHACDCDLRPRPEIALKEADAVFIGVCLGVDGPLRVPVNWNADGSPTLFRMGGFYAELSIVAAWKGVDRDRVIVRTGGGGKDCYFTFRSGSAYLVYARSLGDTLLTTICTRTTSVRNAGLDLEALGEPSLDRRNGRGFDELESGHFCAVHPGEPLLRARVPILDTLVYRPAEPYVEAMRELFTNSRMVEFGVSRFAGVRQVTVYFCKLCRYSELRWKEQNEAALREWAARQRIR
jgi:hypothetical protein